VTFSTVLETLLSLTVQVILVIWMTALLARKTNARVAADSCWAIAHGGILALTAGAFLLPHLRLLTLNDLQPMAIDPRIHYACAVIGRICGWVWLIGAATVFFVCIGGMLRATALVRGAAADTCLEQMLRGAVPGLAAFAKPPEIRVSAVDVSPFCWQFHRPIIVLPASLCDFPAAEQAAIVRHELAHLRLGHPLHLFLQRLVEAVFWFHPLVWWASRQAAAAREFRCDREAVGSRLEVANYLRSLLRLIESQVHVPDRLPAGVGFLGDKSLLSRRASMLAESLDRVARPLGTSRTCLALALIAALCAGIWLPVNPGASRRADWSPWPSWSARALDAAGVEVRDYEVDGHRLNPHEYAPGS
jgi:bla regulator protein blaR1